MKTKLILEILKKTGRATDILLGIFFGGYNYKKMKRKAFYSTLPDFSETNKIEFDSGLLAKEKRRFYTLLSKLKKQGFIKKERKKNKVFWSITLKGEKKLKKLKNILHFPRFYCKQEKDDGINIIIFDIPEKHRAKRDWLRHTLLYLGFIMLQKSVWIGKNKLPEEFLKSLAELNLVDFIQIFKVSKTGSLKEIKK